MNKKLIAGTLLLAMLTVVSAVKVYAQDGETVPTPTVENTADENTPGACMSTAVEKRDMAIIGGWEILSVAMKSALETRKTNLMAAWVKAKTATRTGLQDTKVDVIATNKAYKAAVKKARAEFAKVKATAWKGFNADRVKCKITAQQIKVESQTDDKTL